MKKFYSSALFCAFLAMGTTQAMAEDVATVSPADGSTVNYLSSVVYTVETRNEISIGMFESRSAYVTDAEGNVYNMLKENDNTLAGNQIRFTLSQPILTAGTYTLTVPAGMVTSGGGFFGGGDEMPGITATYTVTAEGLDEVSFNPANGCSVSKISSFEFSFTNESQVALTTLANSHFFLYNGNGYKESELNADNLVIAGNKVTVTFNSEITNPDHYCMVFPEGAFKLGEKARLSTPVVFNFNVEAVQDIAYEVNPANGTTQTALDEFIITFPDMTNVQCVGTSIAIYQDKGDEEVYTKWIANIGNNNPIDDNTWSLRIYSPNMGDYYVNKIKNNPGNYMVKIPAGTFLLGEDQVASPEILLYYVVDPNYVEPEPEPEPEVYTVTIAPENHSVCVSIDEFILTFEGASTVENAATSIAIYSDKGDEEVYTKWVANLSNVTAVADNAFSFSITSPTMGDYYTKKVNNNPGNYMVKVPAGSFLIGEAKTPCEEMLFFYTVDPNVTAISNVRVVIGGNLYTIDGRKTDAQQGIMISNGRKVVIK